MGLQSALSTSLTGLRAAETSIDVAGNNVANSQTVGFKESSVNFATQFLQTQSIGSAPTDTRGGTNPRQIGLGVKVAEISPDFTQGTIEISSNPLDLAIQGDGFFIVQDSGGQYYTRNGQFKTNSQNELVTTTGQRVLGYGVNENYEVQATGLTNLTIPLGASAVAQSTENVFFEGSLDPQSEVGTVPGIIESVVLSDGADEVPDATATDADSLSLPDNTTTVSLGTVGAGSITGTYSYRVTFTDGAGNESPASDITSSINTGTGVDEIQLDNLPTDPTGHFVNYRIYRSQTGASDEGYFLVDEVALGLGTSYTDTDANQTALIAGAPELDDTGLESASYSYYVTFTRAGGEESRPTSLIGPVTVDENSSPRVLLRNIPQPSGIADDDHYTSIRLYRNQAGDSSDFRLVADLAAGTTSFVDNIADADLGSDELDFDGPAIRTDTALVDVVTRDGSDYVNLFREGTLSFTGSRGGRELEAKELNITSSTTLQNLIDFMDNSLGIVESAPESTFPPDDAIASNFGGQVDTGESLLRFVSNLGIENAVEIDLASFQLTTSDGETSSIPLSFSSANSLESNGEGATADFVVYDSLGIPLTVRVTTVLEEKTNNGATFRWIATSPDNEEDVSLSTTGSTTLVGTGVIKTDGLGNIVSGGVGNVAINRRQSPSASPLVFDLDFTNVSGLSTGSNELSASRQDGFAAGTLSSFIISETGLIQGVFSNGSTRDLGQIMMARFANNSGLEQYGDNLFAAGVNSGLPVLGEPGSNGIGAVTAGAVELSNTDIGQNLIELILASTQYRGGARVITSVQQLLDELLNLRR